MRTPHTLVSLFTMLAISIAGSMAQASSHREAPAITKDPTADNTDTYAFVSPDRPSTVTLIANWIPVEEPAGGPNFFNFDENAWYYIKIDNDGDALADITFEFKFTTSILNGNTFLYNTGPITSLDDPDYNFRQTYTVTRYDEGAPTVLGSNLPVPPSNIGPKSTPDYTALAQTAIRTLSDDTRVFAGQRDDPFFVDTGALFDLLTIRRLPGNTGGGVDGLGGFNVHTIALQVPKSRLTSGGGEPGSANAVIGVWSTTERSAQRTLLPTGAIEESGGHVQVSRLGMPLVNEVVIPLKDKDKFNASEPVNDLANFGAYVVDPELARLLTALYGIAVPPPPRNDLVAVFATGIPNVNQPANVVPAEMVRLNMTTTPATSPNRFGVIAGDASGFPNGRRLADDVTDIELRAVAGGYVLTPEFDVAPNNQLGDGVDFNDRPFLPYFPYVATPHQGFCHRHHDDGSGFRPPGQAKRGSGRPHPVFGPSDCDDADAATSAAAVEAVEVGSVAASSSQALTLRSGAGDLTLLQYTVTAPAHVSLRIHDLQGRTVRTLVDQDAASGTFAATWDGRDTSGAPVAKGVYFVRFATGDRAVDHRKVVVR